MKQSINLKAKGLHTFENPLSLPAGSLLRATNVVVDRPDTVETRRGFKIFGDDLNFDGSAITSFQSRLIVNNGEKLSYDSDGLGAWVDYTGTFVSPSDYRMKFSESNKNLYFTTTNGPYKLDAYNSTPVLAGAPQALGGTAATTGATGFMTNNTNVAYRITWAYEDANNNFIEGAPSQRIITTNATGGTRDVALTFLIPSGVTTSYVYRIYRSPLTVNTTTEPIDDMQLVVEFNPTAGQIVAKSVTVTDSTPDALKGAALYTGSNQEGIANANDRPPLAKDIALFKGSMLYLNISTEQTFDFTLQTRLAINDTVTIAGVVYTAKAAESVGSNQFKTFTAGTLADDIEDTALSLVSIINQSASNTTIYAIYLSGYNDLPGQMRVYGRNLGVAAFTTQSSVGSAWTPALTAAVTSDNEENPSYLAISKDGQPEAVPFKNRIPVGSANKAGLRLVPLRDTVMIYKEDGVFALSGNNVDDFQIIPFDNTVTLIAPDTAVTFNNSAFAFTNQGIVSTSNAEGSPIMSRAIEQALIEVSSDLFPFFPTATWAAAYESDRKYIVGTVSSEASETAQQMYVFNALTNAWVLWDIAATHGIVNPADGKFYFLHENNVYQERKTFTRADYADSEIEVTITDVDDTTITLTDTTGITAGDSLFQANDGDGIDAIIVSVDSATEITIDSAISFSTGDALVLMPIETEIEWAPIHMDNPAIVKHNKEFIMFFRTVDFADLDLSFTTDLVSEVSSSVIVPTVFAGWNDGGWNKTGWEGGSNLPQAIRTFVPLSGRRARWISPKIHTSQALTNFAMTGWSLVGDYVSTRTK